MKTLNHDGKGVNDKRSEYAPRVATFSTPEYAKEFGILFEASPNMLAALRAVQELVSSGAFHDQTDRLQVWEQVDAAVKAATKGDE